MLIRFCVYGFLKNQRYFEPFLFLAFLDKGLSFTEIGLLLAIEGITVHLLEIPSGALADLFSRRRALLSGFGFYGSSFVVLGLASSYPALCAGMVLFGAGESLRSGSHKAMVFAWLRLEGRSEEKTRIYGCTRSWSKAGSAVSALVAAALVYGSASYVSVFLWSLVPCGLSMVNLLGYPAAIDLPAGPRVSMGSVWGHLRTSLAEILARPPLRRLLVESTGFHGLFRASKDYLQPALVAAAVAWFGTSQAGSGEGPRDTAFLVGTVYSGLFLAAALASRNAHRFASWAGGEGAAARRLWMGMALLFACLAGGSLGGLPSLMIAGFVLLHLLQNLWRPILTSRIYDLVDENRGATVLSVESQGHRLATVVLAPLFGFLVDSAGAFWPAAAVALAVAVVFLWVSRPER